MFRRFLFSNKGWRKNRPAAKGPHSLPVLPHIPPARTVLSRDKCDAILRSRKQGRRAPQPLSCCDHRIFFEDDPLILISMRERCPGAAEREEMIRLRKMNQ